MQDLVGYGKVVDVIQYEQKLLRTCKQESNGLRFEFLERSLWLLYGEPTGEGKTGSGYCKVLVGGNDSSWVGVGQ